MGSPGRKREAIETKNELGAQAKRLFPTPDFAYYDPFVLMDEFFVQKSTGSPPLPHRGFEAITYMIEGAL
ncbi:MAG: pirin family protein, partial [Candidatus Ranarchaeia archaeon]